MVLLRRLVGDVLRRHRQRQSRTLREVSAAAQVSLGYLSEVERGRKEASSELLASICAALDVSLADVLREVSDDLLALERRPMAPLGFVPGGRAAADRSAGVRVGSVAGIAPLVPGRTAALRVSARPEATPVARLSIDAHLATNPVVAA
jgi:transcriptional regulator with XRE-family HTH domain